MDKELEYFYCGPVSVSYPGRIQVSSYKWSGRTTAKNRDRAISNLKYQYRQKYKLSKGLPLILDINYLIEGDQ